MALVEPFPKSQLLCSGTLMRFAMGFCSFLASSASFWAEAGTTLAVNNTRFATRKCNVPLIYVRLSVAYAVCGVVVLSSRGRFPMQLVHPLAQLLRPVLHRLLHLPTI